MTPHKPIVGVYNVPDRSTMSPISQLFFHSKTRSVVWPQQCIAQDRTARCGRKGGIRLAVLTRIFSRWPELSHIQSSLYVLPHKCVTLNKSTSDGLVNISWLPCCSPHFTIATSGPCHVQDSPNSTNKDKHEPIRKVQAIRRCSRAYACLFIAMVHVMLIHSMLSKSEVLPRYPHIDDLQVGNVHLCAL